MEKSDFPDLIAAVERLADEMHVLNDTMEKIREDLDWSLKNRLQIYSPEELA